MRRTLVQKSGRARSAGVVLAASLIGGCLYGFAGGGLPPHIRTVAILPFDNQTSQSGIAQQVGEALREAMQGRLGLRASGEATADAVVRGTITRYESDIPLSFQTGQGAVAVTRRRVQLSLDVEIFDVRQQRTLWKRANLTVDGEYDPPQEQRGRELALAKLVSDIVDGAQSQW